MESGVPAGGLVTAADRQLIAALVYALASEATLSGVFFAGNDLRVAPSLFLPGLIQNDPLAQFNKVAPQLADLFIQQANALLKIIEAFAKHGRLKLRDNIEQWLDFANVHASPNAKERAQYA